MQLSHELLQTVADIAVQAGHEILDVYQRPGVIDIVSKSDDSPLTEADIRAHRVIVAGLEQLSPQLPVLSEESALVGFEQRRHWDEYWLVDPLDGTKEFISGNGEFTVNIALVRQNRPVLGVVHVPVTGVTYLGISDGPEQGAWRRDAEKKLQCIRVQALPPSQDWPEHTLRMVASRRHGDLSQDHSELARHFRSLDLLNMGSSLKICLLAEGQADIYPRLAPTSEWDTAAAHAVLTAAGGEIFDLALEPLLYNRKESMLNPYFLAITDTSDAWKGLLRESYNKNK